jgi:CMP-N,N'-diacetyllegionaminic acid synthase
MIIGHIGARQGSKGLIGKNFKTIAGKPLIDWSLDQLIKNKNISEIIVSTDDPVIYKHCIQKGALDIGLRPAELSSDTASKWNVWQHSLKLVEAIHDDIDIFLDLDCTAPLRDAKDIDNAIELFLDEKPDMVMSCCEAKKNPYFNMLELNSEGSLRVSKSLEKNIVARQLAPTVYEHAASTYLIKPEYLKSANFLYEGRVIPIMMSPENCIDIDSELDYKIVSYLMEERFK